MKNSWNEDGWRLLVKNTEWLFLNHHQAEVQVEVVQDQVKINVRNEEVEADLDKAEDQYIHEKVDTIEVTIEAMIDDAKEEEHDRFHVLNLVVTKDTKGKLKV